MFNSNMPSLSDIAAVTGNRNDGGWGDGNGWWVLIILFAIFGGWGGNNGWGNNGNGGYAATAATQADIQRGFDTSAVTNKLNGLENGLCDGFYSMNTAVMSGTNTLQNAIPAGFYGQSPEHLHASECHSAGHRSQYAEHELYFSPARRLLL